MRGSIPRNVAVGMALTALLLSACAGQAPAAPDWRSDPDEPYPFTRPLPALEATAIDGTYTRQPTDPYTGSRATCQRCPPYPLDRGNSTLVFDRGRFQMRHAEPAYRSSGHYLVEGDRLTLLNDAECTQERGEYRWVLDHGELRVELLSDPCAFGQRARDFTAQPWSVADTASPHRQPPDEEAAVAGHWPIPSGC
jgi:hypothetical protein